VVICLDADVSTNLDVYKAALDLKAAVRAEGAASVKFARLAAKGTNGLDDILAKRAEATRTAYLERLITDAAGKPADVKPTPKRQGSDRLIVTDASTAERPQIFVDGDRLDVINQLTSALLLRWNSTRMFDHGGVLSVLSSTRTRGQNDVPIALTLDKKTFTDLIQETAVTVRRAGKDGESVAYCYPEGQTVDALLSRHRRFVPLDRIARVPFVRADGSICQANGYDEASSTLLVMDEALADIRVGDDPTADDLASAVKLIREEWLYDFFAEMPSDADRANAVALALTPFIRGLVDVVPLAVVDGIGMGVGKNLFADVTMAIPATGSALQPLNWSSEDEENRKQITSAFIDGADVFVFDEAHHLHGASLARALTAAYWKDRHLGHNQMLGFPNMVTWVSLGNNVRVEGDITRRVYRIAIRPDHPNPMDRPASSFRQPNIRGWVRRNRGEIVQALLTLIRSWYAAGQPAAPKDVSFGSFERWERIVGGILHHAGFGDFLGNTKAWRAETSYNARYWTAHVRWLFETFGNGRVFTCAQVRDGLQNDRNAPPPPDMTDLSSDPRAYNRHLGQAYAERNERYFDDLRLVKAEGRLHNNVTGWMVVGPGGEEAPTTGGPISPLAHSVTGSTGGSGGTGGSSTPSYVGEKNIFLREHAPRNVHVLTHVLGGLDSPLTPIPPETGELGSDQGEADTAPDAESGEVCASGHAELDIPCANDVAESVTPLPKVIKRPELDRVEAAMAVAGGDQLDLFTSDAEPALAEYERIDIATLDARGAVTLPDGVLALDIETPSAAELWTYGDGFVRLSGYQQGDRITITTDPEELAERVRTADLVIGHNVMSFDLVALATRHGVDLVRLAREALVFDTMLAGILNDPPRPGMSQGQIQREYTLDAIGDRLVGETKSGDLKALTKEFGGFDRIPTDDRRYVEYLVGDVDLTARLAKVLKTSPYVRREHVVAAIAAQIRINGFRVDVDELNRRIAANQQARRTHLAALTLKYGLPTTKADGKESKSPHATKEGKTAIVQAFTDLGVTLPNTENGQPSFGKVALAQVTENHAADPDVLALVDLVSSLNGVRTVYETVGRYLVGDRVHPEIGLFQASGRWSTTEPGLTVFGKRGGKYREREVFLADEGHVIISVDLAQVDARAIAALSQDRAYLAMFEPGLDLHREIAKRIWGDPERREDAKALGHGWNYGMGLTGLQRNAKVDEDTARRFDDGMRDQFPRLVEWRTEVRQLGESGVMLDNGFGRLMRVDPNRAWTQAPALMGQGCARDIMMEGLLRLPDECLPMLRAVVHDEVILSVPADVVEDVERTVVAALSFPWKPPGAEFEVQIEAGLAKHRGRNWGDVYAK
jgi:hypothetical protein